MNPGYGASPYIWALPSKLPAKSRIEIHSTGDSNLPYEIRWITVRELSEQESRVSNVFVEVVVENHTRTQSFELILGDDRGGRGLSLMARTDGKIVKDTAEVNRDCTSQIHIAKNEMLERVYVRPKNEGCWVITKNILCRALLLFRSCLKNFIGQIIGLFIPNRREGLS
ncbi:MAG TPA: hypothetical protein VLE95_05435 [Chlamydiales bacterium]|nr:hypothetical protein [Chlamydiales bacterium]